MTKKKKYLDTLLQDLTDRTGWDCNTLCGIMIDYLESSDLSDSFLNYAEQIAEEELKENG